MKWANMEVTKAVEKATKSVDQVFKAMEQAIKDIGRPQGADHRLTKRASQIQVWNCSSQRGHKEPDSLIRKLLIHY